MQPSVATGTRSGHTGPPPRGGCSRCRLLHPSGHRDDGTHGGCHCHADVLHVHTCVSSADAGPCDAQGGRHRGSVGPAPSQSSCAPASASRVSAHPSLLALGAFPLTAPAQYVFKGLPLRLPLSFCICLLPCVFLVAWHLGLSTVPEVCPHGRGCWECVCLCSFSLRRLLRPAWFLGGSCQGSMPPASQVSSCLRAFCF